MPRKSGTGCITCRIRRVKCDEAKPSCRRCLSSKRKCDGYLPEESTVTRRQLVDAARQISVIGPISQALTQYPRYGSRSATPPNLSLFDVFRNLTAPSTASFIPSQFWTRELLQLAHSEPAIWHATLALGALHQRHELTWQGHGDQSSRGLWSQANASYARSMSYAQGVKDPTRLLSLSLALVSITNMMGRWSESQVHIGAGHRLLKQAGHSTATTSAAEILTRLDLQAMTLSDSSAPYEYKDAPRVVQIDDFMRQTSAIQSYAQAGTALFGLMRRFMLLGETMAEGEEDDDSIVNSLAQDLVSWEFKMGTFEGHHQNPHQEVGAISIRLYHTLLRMCMAGGFGPETRWDEMLGYFERILALGESLWSNTRNNHVQSPLSLEPGLIVPAFMTAQRCRHPWLRRRTIAFLRKLKRQEGMWSSDGAAAVAQKIMEVEGQVFYESEPPLPAPMDGDVPWEAWAAGNVQLPSRTSWAGIQRVPGERRVASTLVMVHAEDKTVDLSLILCAGDEMGSYGGVRTETVVF
ncbi:hypothetical protein FZEAL_8628 [Fusarium zealandicum]|uniref:Zn(2)-C6 fungal-type domain-containing protein n=1 Tax=Fusarium zealandicum TaxID=1053134 RepID=A0A8H4XHA6_9HYPO|nr:hypothetical protein FZEAL_8628 [Fusarium zealandicum]